MRPDGRADPARPGAAADEARLSASEQRAIDDAVVPIGRRGNGPLVVVVLVVAAFAVGILRPWDLVAPPAPAPAVPAFPGTPPGDSSGSPVPVPGASSGGDAVAGLPVESADVPTCGYPTSWRTASIQEWAGAYARVWSAAEAVEAAGPEDPAIPFHVLASESVRAIGWCAPIRGDERPPLAAVGTLFRLRDGVALEVPVERREPSRPDALGELWLPRPYRPGRHRPWTDGRYVIRLATPTGSYVRYLGLEVGVPQRDEPPAGGSPSPSAGASLAP